MRASIELPGIRLVSGDNSRVHWRTKWLRNRAHKSSTVMVLRSKLGRPPELPITVTITRVGPNKRPLDSDGLASACKYVRDGVAQWVGVDDGDQRYTWICRQQYGKRYCVVIEIESGEEER